MSNNKNLMQHLKTEIEIWFYKSADAAVILLTFHCCCIILNVLMCDWKGFKLTLYWIRACRWAWCKRRSDTSSRTEAICGGSRTDSAWKHWSSAEPAADRDGRVSGSTWGKNEFVFLTAANAPQSFCRRSRRCCKHVGYFQPRWGGFKRPVVEIRPNIWHQY